MIRLVDRDTVAVYEQRATEWRDKRPVRFPELAKQLADEVARGAVRVDLGCGSGGHLQHLGRPVVALDAAFAMVELAREAAPDAWGVQADLESLPFRNASIGGSWARASYLHVQQKRLPWALMQLHRALHVSAPAAFTMRHGSHEGAIEDDEFEGRLFAEWEPEPLRDVLVGAGFVVDALTWDGGEWINVHATRARTLPDFVDRDMRLLLCGLNPSIYAADAGVGFARPGNRFWPAALAAGVVSRDRDPIHALVEHRIGMTDLCKRATARADELAKEEFEYGMRRVEGLVRWLQPGAVCFVGLAGWRAAVDRKAVAGEQPDGFGGVPAYVMPNPSGLNAKTSLDDFAVHLRAAAELADSR
jgi:TDG/mug DNA glycosylase family protein